MLVMVAMVVIVVVDSGGFMQSCKIVAMGHPWMQKILPAKHKLQEEMQSSEEFKEV